MTITSPPSAAEIRVESRLRPEQVNVTFADNTVLESDIDNRIGKYQALINKKISSVEDDEDNQVIASEALSLRVLASLFGSAGYLNQSYWVRAEELKAESNELIADLLADNTNDVEQVAGAGVIRIAVGESFACGDEYADC